MELALPCGGKGEKQRRGDDRQRQQTEIGRRRRRTLDQDLARRQQIAHGRRRRSPGIVVEHDIGPPEIDLV